MPSIKSTLSKYDLDFLLRIARAWDVEISQRDAKAARSDLMLKMTQKELFVLLFNGLDEPVTKAWKHLVSKGGRQTWSEFSRLYGEIRDLGPAARERETPDLHPISISETLLYKGLISRAFFRGKGEPVETVFIPDELMAYSEKPLTQPEKTLIRPAVNQSPRFVTPADTAILDQLTDLLAANRMQRELPETVFTAWGKPQRFLKLLLSSATLIDPDGQPNVDELKTFFSHDRDTVLFLLFQSWVSSTTINELRLLQGLTCEGNWENDPRVSRKLVIDIVKELEPGTWWSLSSLISMVKEVNPDFQRPAGDYDSWFIREDKTGGFLSGFSSWDRVEGELLHFLVTGPLRWFGIVNLARGSNEGRFTAFQLVPQTCSMLSGDAPGTHIHESKHLQVKDVRTLVLPLAAPRTLRYQVGRLSKLIHATSSETRYLLTVESLEKAEEQGLQIQQIIKLIEKTQPGVVPAGLQRLAERWTSHGVEADIKQATLLRFKDSAACSELVTAAGNRFNFEVLNSQTLLIKTQQLEGVRRLLAELGILVDDEADV